MRRAALDNREEIHMAIKRPSPSFLVFRDKEGHWRWNFVGPGGRVLAVSRQAYKRPVGCMRAIRLLKGSSEIPVVGVEADLKEVRAARAGNQGAVKAAGSADKASVSEKAATKAKSTTKD